MRIRLHILSLLLLLCFCGTAHAQQTTVTGVLRTPTHAPDKSGVLWLYEARKAGEIHTYGAIKHITNSSGELLETIEKPGDGGPGMKVPRGSQILIFSTANGLNSCRDSSNCPASRQNAVWKTVPNQETAALESLVTVTLQPASFGNPMTGLGDSIYGSTNGLATRLAGNTSTTRKLWTQTGDGTHSAAPVLAQIGLNDLSNVAISSPLNGQRLVYNSSTGKFENTTVAGSDAVWGSINGMLADQLDLAAALAGKSNTGHAHVLVDITNAGTAAAKNYPASGNAAAGEVVLGNDGRLSDARTPTSHAASHKHGGADEVATATPGANAIPKAGSGGTLAAGWLPDLSATYEPANANIQAHISSTSNPHSVTKSQVGLGSVENTALSTWSGSANINTVGTVGTGVWQGTAIADSFIASAATWNAKQAAGNYITGLTGDGTASGPGSPAFTLATVNSNVGTFNSATVTVDAKGRVTAASSGSGGGLTTGTTTIASGSNTKVLFNNSGVLGEYSITGTGNVVMSASPSLTGSITVGAGGHFYVTPSGSGQGSASAPVFGLSGGPGLYFPVMNSSYGLALSRSGSVAEIAIDASSIIKLNQNITIGFVPANDAATSTGLDIAFARAAARKVKITDGGSNLGDLQMRSFDFNSGSADPTTSDIPSGGCIVWKNTTLPTRKLWCNDGGTLYSVALN